MQKTFLIFLLCLASMGAFAQSTEEDVVLFNNGNILRGRIIETVPGEYIKLEVQGYAVITFDIKDIAKITKSQRIPTANGSSNSAVPDKQKKAESIPLDPSTIKKKGITVAVESCLMLTTEYYQVGGIQVIPGYRIAPWLQAGIGLGVNNTNLGLTLPIFLDVRGVVLKGTIAPMYEVGGGINFPTTTRSATSIYNQSPPSNPTPEPGSFLNLGVGAKIMVTKSFGVHSFITYRHEESYGIENAYGNFMTYTDMFGLTVGISF